MLNNDGLLCKLVLLSLISKIFGEGEHDATSKSIVCKQTPKLFQEVKLQTLKKCVLIACALQQALCANLKNRNEKKVFMKDIGYNLGVMNKAILFTCSVLINSNLLI